MPQRRYTENDLGVLIQRATELQEAADGQQASTLSLEDLEHIAAEIGLDPAHLRTAALELDSRARVSPGGFSLTGAPFSVSETRAVPGSLTEEQWAHAVELIRQFTGSAATWMLLVQHASGIRASRIWVCPSSIRRSRRVRTAIRPPSNSTTAIRVVLSWPTSSAFSVPQV